MSKTLHLIAMLAALLGGAAADAAEVVNLYRAKAIVTGQTEKNRPAGFAQCLTDVLVKASGDPRLLDDPRVAAMAKDAAAYISEFSYRDRMEGIPVHDEQGTRDRPYDLTCDFYPDKVNAALQNLGRTLWSPSRPRLAVFLAVRNGPSTYVLTDDGKRGPGQRESFLAASWKLGVPVDLPKQAELAAAGLGFDTLAAMDLASLDAAAKTSGADQALAGSMEFSDAAHGWIAEWRLAAQGREHRWGVRGVNFDEVFRVGLRGAAQILSGNGAPG